MVRRKYKKIRSRNVGGAAVGHLQGWIDHLQAVQQGGGLFRRKHIHQDRFHFCDYNPMCFRQLRECFGIDCATYTKCLSEVWTTLVTPGKSNALLYFAGNTFVIKTLTSSESKFLKSILCGYFKHIQANPHTLITRFYGHHCLTHTSTRTQIRFVVMNNVFQTDNYIGVKYDLKGSTFGREATAEQKARKDVCILKDNDLGSQRIHIGSQRTAVLMQQMKRDVEFLKRMDIMDYSFFAGHSFSGFCAGRPIPWCQAQRRLLHIGRGRNGKPYEE
eukprot:NODE_832_length_1163_cov_362.270197_g586_i0.p1 GENE.NODE_832_length_1163_cov_362.270197_g586_i0~~NODE_832_length_1163_cov_362.270197_g586_i0.p1  ORF type:complete len:274 (+),score=50.34 NODE_832_length_1163_cov_362.270197_g586_i0:50-871(+)